MSKPKHLIQITGYLPYKPTRTEQLIEIVLSGESIQLGQPAPLEHYDSNSFIRREGISTDNTKKIVYWRHPDPDSIKKCLDERIKILSEKSITLPNIPLLMKKINRHSDYHEIISLELYNDNSDPFDLWLQRYLFFDLEPGSGIGAAKFLEGFFQANSKANNYLSALFHEIAEGEGHSWDRVTETIKGQFYTGRSKSEMKNATLSFLTDLLRYYITKWKPLDKDFKRL